MAGSDMAKFRSLYQKAKNVVVLTGAGVSAESGVPTFRGSGGLWRRYRAQDLATPTAFQRDPSLVWEFYHYRRETVLTKRPNAAHFAIAESQRNHRISGSSLIVITQNIDGLHQQAGTKDVQELHGSLFRVRCTSCEVEVENKENPICESLRNRGAPDVHAEHGKIPVGQLPLCSECGGLLRPAVVWFGEPLNDQVMEEAGEAMEKCDLCLVVGTSSVVYPAAMFSQELAARGVPVAEFNTENTEITWKFGFHFRGPCGETLPKALA